MKTALTGLLLIAIAFQVSADEPAVDGVKRQAIDKELETFAGTWEAVSTQPKEIGIMVRRLILRKDMTFAVLDKENKELWSGTYDLDPLATPKIWDHRSNDSQKKGGRYWGFTNLMATSSRWAAWPGSGKTSSGQVGPDRPSSSYRTQKVCWNCIACNLNHLEVHVGTSSFFSMTMTATGTRIGLKPRRGSRLADSQDVV